MEILERYLQAVRKYLPWQRQDDIIAELRANMESQVEDAESDRGRPLTQAEMEELLKKMGPPILVASRYQPQRSLIGPTIFPIYLYVLRLAALWASIIYLVAMAIVVPLTAPHAVNVVESVLRLPAVLFYTAAWITLVFAGIEFVATRHPEKCPPLAGLGGAWSPASLPPLEKMNAAGGRKRSFAHAVAEVVFGFLVLAWLALVPKNPYLLMGPGEVVLYTAPFVLSTVWWTFYWWVIALNIVQLLWRLTDLIRGTWRGKRRLQILVNKALGIIPVALILSFAHQKYVLLRHPETGAAHYGATLETINKSIHLGLMVILAIVSLQLLWDVAQAVRDARRKRLAAL